ncbi:MAG: 30S ribosomal protein S9 [Chlorobi bacterium]|nr:MAG: 30S ribosomal protein S9 [Chlorobi bacterium OLB7]MBK8912063.1 30S ribosomal protein S9 [Chlorobiota bacterium]MBX7217162.1 30S ribosomal protein S9 [Candidatus Kapabacteria bacterium]MCE7934257.1 30S ribosomal protein S9 [Chlorobi bacterium CHB2]
MPNSINVGRRKNAVARVYLTPGSGNVTVNNRELINYFSDPFDRQTIMSPLVTVEMVDRFDVHANVNGGGRAGQAGAIRLGIARALVEIDETLKSPLRKGGHMTRDPRMVERKKYGQKKARKRFQFSKR